MDMPRRQAERVRALIEESDPPWMSGSQPRWRLLPDYLGQHVMLSAAALALGILAISALIVVQPAAVRALRWPVLAFASLIQTVPSLALLALFYPLLLALVGAVADGCSAQGFAALGFLPSLLALTLYSMLPILRNGVDRHRNDRSGGHRGRARRRHDGPRSDSCASSCRSRRRCSWRACAPPRSG